MTIIHISESIDYSDTYISTHFQDFMNHVLQQKSLRPDVKDYMICVCGDILMCNIEHLNSYEDKLNTNQHMETFEEKIFKVHRLLTKRI